MLKDPLAHLPPEVRLKMREYFMEEAYPLVDQLEADLLIQVAPKGYKIGE